MKAKLTAAVAAVIAFASMPSAYAQEKTSWFDEPLAAPKDALEIVVGTGYTQGFGSLSSGVDMGNVATAGIGVDLGLGYRINPHWALMMTGQYQEFTAERSSSARGFVPGIAAVYHIAPYTRTDPWISLGAGYRFLWENQQSPNPQLLTHGIELAKLTVGVDIRVHRDVAIAPVVGADLTLPLGQSVDQGASQAISNPTVSTYVFAGLQARFDIASTHEELGRPLPPPAAKTEITRAVVEQPQPKPEEMKPVSPSINASEELIDKCKLHFSDVEKAPKFEFDKAELLPADYEILTKIAVCLTSDPLKEAGISLVGRADPRGSEQYNEKLGLRRANNVGKYLEQLGVEMTRMDRSSRGKRDAVGIDEASWAMDRRVDISLSH